MIKVKTIRNLKKIAGKKILLRVDFNVPIKAGKILDDYKIVEALPTIRFLSRYGAKIIIITHLGRPNGKRVEKYTVRPVAERLNKLLNKPVGFSNGCFNFKDGNKVSSLKNGEILVLENLRFIKGEEKNSSVFAKELANLADIYVNEAFANSHRRHASMSRVKEYLPAYAGLQLAEEIKNLSRILKPAKPLVAVIGGAKIKTKIRLLKKLSKKGAKILIGGALANNFLQAHNFEVGESLVDKESLRLARKFKNHDILLPVDVVVWGGRVKNINQVQPRDRILDIGPDTVRLYANHIKKAKTIIWNGSMGVFEKTQFKHGSLNIGRAIASRAGGKAFGVAGGGETIKVLQMTKMEKYMDWISTGGGAMLTFLGGEDMPGLEKLIR